MTKPVTNARAAFKESFARMLDDFRRDLDEHIALIGKATLALLAEGQPVTRTEIAARVTQMGNGKNDAVVAQAIKHLDHIGSTS